MSQSGNTSKITQPETAATSNNLYLLLNPLLLGLDIAILLALLLLRYTSITGAVIAVFSFFSGIIFGLFPGLRTFHQQRWFHSRVMTVLFSVIFGIGATVLVYPYFAEVQTTAKSTSNLLVNADFEQSIHLKRWDGSDNAELKWEDGHTGNGLCLIQKATEEQSEPEWAFMYQTVEVMPSQLYNFSAYMKWVDATQAHLKVDWYTADDEWIDWDLLSPMFDGNSGGWTWQNKTVTVPADATKASIVAVHGVANDETNVPGGTLCVDEIVFEPYSAP